ncbi:hypothetical protein ACOMHN_054118 [Nucella lapillus]
MITSENRRQSVDEDNIPGNTEDEGFLFSHLTFDCLEDIQVSSENEEQITHLLLTEDTPETREDPQQSDYHTTDWKQKSSHEETSDSESVFSGHTYSRAMWRSMSAEAGHHDLSFSSRTPLYEAFSRFERQCYGSTSSEEEWKLHQCSLFNGLSWSLISDLSSSDSHRSSSLTPGGKGDTESVSSSSADSVRTVYFVLEKTASVDTSSVTHVAKRSQISQSKIQMSLSDLNSSSGPKVSDVDERSKKKRRRKFLGIHQDSMLTQDIAEDGDQLWDKHYKGKSKRAVRSKPEGLPFVDEEDKPKPAGHEQASLDHPRKSDKEKLDKSDAASTATATESRCSQTLKPRQSPRIRKAATRTSSLSSSSPESQSISGTHRGSDTDRKTLARSCSSSNDLLTSESELGPLVSFPRRTMWGGTVLSSVDAESEADAEQNLTAVELRRQYSAEEYVPPSPYASHLKRSPFNRSEGSRPLFLQRQRSHSRSRQVSMDIGEEWESVQSPQPSLPPIPLSKMRTSSSVPAPLSSARSPPSMNIFLDYEFDFGSLEKVRHYGHRTTVLYVIGTVVAVCFLVACSVAAVVYLQDSLLKRLGWS